MGDGPAEREGGKQVAPRSVEGGSQAARKHRPQRIGLGAASPCPSLTRGLGAALHEDTAPGCPDLVGHSPNFKMTLNWLSISENLNW